jgi:hypothetical protein
MVADTRGSCQVGQEFKAEIALNLEAAMLGPFLGSCKSCILLGCRVSCYLTPKITVLSTWTSKYQTTQKTASLSRIAGRAVFIRLYAIIAL